MKKTLLASLAVLAMGFSTSFAIDAGPVTANGTVTYNVVEPLIVTPGTVDIDYGNVMLGTNNAPTANTMTFNIKGNNLQSVVVDPVLTTTAAIPAGIAIAYSAGAAVNVTNVNTANGEDFTYTFGVLTVSAGYTTGTHTVTYVCSASGTY